MTLRKAILCSSALLLLCAAPPITAQDEPGPTADGSPPAVTENQGNEGGDANGGDVNDGQANSATGPRVLCTYLFAASAEPQTEPQKCADDGGSGLVYLGDRLVVRVSGLSAWLEAEEKERGDLRLFLDGVEITDLEAEAVQAVEGSEGESDVRFHLQRDADNRDSWRTLLGPFQTGARAVTVGVGLAGEEEIAGSSSTRIDLQAVRLGWLKFYAVLLFAFLVLFFTFRWRGRKLTDSLRDAQAEGSPKPYSLARCQMAWWFFLVIAAYVFLWLVLGDLDTITGSVLTLMGIGSGTALGAAMIDSNKKATEEQAEAEMTASQVRATATATPDDQVRLATARAKLENVQGAVKKGTHGFLSDLLSDGNGYSFHRFQIFVWTIILGIIFVVSVLHELAMPQFSDTLLALMGISSGTYLGFKFPEQFEE